MSRKCERQTLNLTSEEAAKITDRTSEEEPEMCLIKTRELLSKAQLLLSDIEHLLDQCTKGPIKRRQREMIQQCQVSIEEDGETLDIEGFRFTSAVSREDLTSLTGGGGGCQGNT